MSGKIDNKLFQAHEHALEHEPCPVCYELHGGLLVLRHGKQGAFLGCNRYPDCDYIKPLHHNDGHIVKSLGISCPECSEELVLRQGRYGMFVGCSGYPNCHHIESIDKQPSHDASLPLCPICNKGTLVERHNRFGKIFWACSNYPKCKFAVNMQPVIGKCERCGFPLLVEKKSTKGFSVQCAERKCQHVQNK